METAIKYKVIKSRKQYDEYADTLEELVFANKKTKILQEEIDLLTLLVSDYDARYTSKQKIAPARLLQSFIDDHQLTGTKMANILGVSKGYISDILNGKKPITIEIAIKLGKYFKVEPTAFYNPIQEFEAAAKKLEVFK